MKKLIGFFVCVSLCTVLGLGSTGCTKKTDTKTTDTKKTTEKKVTEEKKTATDSKKTVTEKKETEEKKTQEKKVEKKVEEKKTEEKKTEEKKTTEKKAGNTHEGTFVSASGKSFKMKHKGEDKEHEHTLAANAKVTNDGKDAELADLKSGQRIRVTTAAGDVKTATRVEALNKDKDF